MNSLEIKVHLSGAELEALQKLSGVIDDPTRLRQTARTVLKTTLLNMATAMSACLEGRAGDIEVGENSIEEQQKL